MLKFFMLKFSTFFRQVARQNVVHLDFSRVEMSQDNFRHRHVAKANVFNNL